MDFECMAIDLRKVNKWIAKRFPDKDIITMEELFGDYQELIDEVEGLEEQVKDLENDLENNYTPVRDDPDPYERW